MRNRQTDAAWSVKLSVICFFTCTTAMAALAAPPSAPAGGRSGAAAATDASTRGSGFAEVVDRVRSAAVAKSWEKPGWDDAVLKDGITGLVEQAKRAAGEEDIALPVGFGDVQPAPRVPGGELRHELWLGGDASVGFADHSIILSDGNLKVGFADDCVIVARGAVELAHGNHNVVLAGRYIHVSHDGTLAPPQRPAPPGRGRSLLISGGYVDVSHATGTICSAPRLVRIGHAHDVTVLNSPKLQASHQQNCNQVHVENFTLAPPEKPNPLEGRLHVRRVVHSDDVERRFVVLDQGGADVTLKRGAEIGDAAGKRIADLAEWKLTFVCNDFALFSNGREDAGFLVPRTPPP